MALKFFLKMKHARKAPAVFTVEAALLMAVILPVLLCLIYIGFLDYDKGVLTAAACETAALADNHLPDSGRNAALSAYAQKLGKASVMSSRGVTGTCAESGLTGVKAVDVVGHFTRVDAGSVTVTYTGSISLPGALPRLFGSGTLSSGCKVSRTILNPAELIRIARAFDYVVDLLEEPMPTAEDVGPTSLPSSSSPESALPGDSQKALPSSGSSPAALPAPKGGD